MKQTGGLLIRGKHYFHPQLVFPNSSLRLRLVKIKDQYVKPATQMVPLGGSTTFRFFVGGRLYIYNPYFKGLQLTLFPMALGTQKVGD